MRKDHEHSEKLKNQNGLLRATYCAVERLERRTFLSRAVGAEVLPDGSDLATPQTVEIVTADAPSYGWLNGDANRDGAVTLRDLDIVAANFGRSGTDFAHGDFNSDGTTDFDDLVILAGQFGKTLPPGTSGFGQLHEAPLVGESIDPDDSFVMGSDYVLVIGGGGKDGCYSAQRYNAAGAPQGTPFQFNIEMIEGRVFTCEGRRVLIAGAGNREEVRFRLWEEMFGRPMLGTTALEAPAEPVPVETTDPFETTELSNPSADDELVPVWELVLD